MVESNGIQNNINYNSETVSQARTAERSEIAINSDRKLENEARETPDSNSQAIQLASNADTLKTAEKKARQQIEKGYLDIRI